MKKIFIFSILLSLLLTSICFANNKAISIRVETSGQYSSLVKNIIQDICLESGYTVVDRENSGYLYYEQDLKNNDRYNSGTAPNSGNMIIATILIKIKTKIEQQYYMDFGGYVGGGYGNVDNTNYKTTMEYSVSIVETGTYSDIKTVSGSANDTDIYGRYKWIRGRYGENSNAVRTASIYDAGINIVPDIKAVLDNYYCQTEGSYQPYPNAQSPSVHYPNSNSNSNTQQNNYNSTSINNQTPTDPYKVNFSQLSKENLLSPQHYILLEPNKNYLLRVYTSLSSAYEVLRIEGNNIIYPDGSIVTINPSAPTKLELKSLGNPGEKIKFALSDENIRKIFEVQY